MILIVAMMFLFSISSPKKNKGVKTRLYIFR